VKLHAIRLAEFRRFETLEITDLAPGLNVFTGPNEAGKSTIAAAIRAAFLERYNTTKVADFATYGRAGARPQVELDFSTKGCSYQLRKAFLSKPRCELVVDGARQEGDQAQQTLAALLGFEFAAKGQSRPEHAGVPGLLWIQQGDGQSFTAVQHAGAHVRDALNRISGELAVGDSDRLLQRVATEKAELLDARGKPRGLYREVEEQLVQALAEAERHAAARKGLESAVDKLAGLRKAHAEDDRDQPWREYEQKAALARERQNAIREERAGLEALRRDRRQVEETLALLQDHVRRDQQDADELRALSERLASACLACEAAEAGLQAATQARATAHETLQGARRRYEISRRAAEKRDVHMLVGRQREELQRLEHTATRARALAVQLKDARDQIVRLDMAQADLSALRTLKRQLDDLDVRRASVATRLHYQLSAPGLLLDGVGLEGEGERLLTTPTTLHLPMGLLTIVPGGADLAQLADRQDVLRADFERAAQALQVASLDEAEARWQQLEAARRNEDGIRREMAIHAPEGLEALERLIGDAGRLMARLEGRLRDMPETTGEDEAISPTLAQAELTDAETALQRADDHVVVCRERAQTGAAQRQQLGARLDVLRRQMEDAQAAARREQLVRRLTESRGERDDIDRRIALAEASIAAHRPELVAQDIERFERSAHIAREAYQSRQREILVLQARLDELGVQGIGESLAQSEADCERLTRRRDAMQRRARALSLLHELLQSQRDAATQRLQAPLTQRLEHYLGLLFPQARLLLDDALQPRGMVRDGSDDALASLSFGTQEQLGILARFAYADLLQQAGRPTLLILDDALVHTDEHRREWMKRALFDAASRHQILMFTCHAAAWKDLGVPQRALPSV